MLAFRDRGARGKVNTGWLDSRHSFSFGHYHDPRHMGFGALRVINEDRVIGGAGFAPHDHADMEILSYVLSGALAHKDSLGTGAVIRPGEIQRMSAGSGIRHSEFNADADIPVHFLQIWIVPDRSGLPPSYEQKRLPVVDRGESRLDLIASRDGSDHAVRIHQDARIWRATLAPGGTLSFDVVPGRRVWVQIALGIATLNGGELRAGDGVGITDETEFELASEIGAELLLFDLA
ncbi:MAG: pirin family protein [Allosphingosinicella sp.]|uniref:pirin family protein n=1 Tax=Allosphingosinicella sp. TaxID=2823234 RepID=UPI0039235B09